MHAATKIECRFSYGYVLLGWFPQLHSTCVDNVIVCWLSILIGIFLIALRFPLFSSVFKTIFDRDSRHVDCLLKIKSRHLYRPLDWFALLLVYVFHVNFCLKFFMYSFFHLFIYFLFHWMTQKCHRHTWSSTPSPESGWIQFWTRNLKKTFIANTKKGWDVIVKDVDEKSWQEKYNEYTTRPKSKSLMLSASSIVNSDMVHFFLRHIKAHSFSLFFKASASEMPIFHIYIYTCFAFNSQFFLLG